MKKSDGTRHFTDEEMRDAKVLAGLLSTTIYASLQEGMKQRPDKMLGFLTSLISMVAWAKDLNLLDFSRMEEERESESVIYSTIQLTEMCQNIVRQASKALLQAMEEETDVKE